MRLILCRLDETAVSVSALRALLSGKLPEYMIPSRFVLMDSLPLMATGKVDRRALPEVENARPKLDTLYVSPRTPAEEQLATIWAEVLSLDRVGIHDDFFDLGGHSLSATRIVSQVFKQFHLEIPLRSLFESPTIAEMAKAIVAHQGKQIGNEALERMLAELETITEEEAQKVLTTQSGRS